jgi:hypothetical protein
VTAVAIAPVVAKGAADEVRTPIVDEAIEAEPALVGKRVKTNS